MKNAALTAPLVPHQQDAIERFFKGNATLYLAFKKAAMGQFPSEMQAIESAFQSGDDAALAWHGLASDLELLIAFDAIKPFTPPASDFGRY